jgi:hypothetical protein
VFEFQDWGGVVVGVDDNLADVFKRAQIDYR